MTAADMVESPLPPWVAPAIVALGLVGLSLVERGFPLRPRVEKAFVHLARNVGSGACALAVSTLLQIGIGAPATSWLRAHGVGLLPLLRLPPLVDLGVGILLLDWTLWVWHLVNHRVGFFWRFHLVHHVDLDLDASTGLRFHPGELALSTFYRVLQVAVLGVSPLALTAWQAALFASVLFHHSNTRLPLGLERVLVHLFVTPRMHGIHHSMVRTEANRNFASLLTLWDRLHGTLHLDVRQADVTIGIPRFRGPRDVSFARVMALPLTARGDDDWRLPDGSGTVPTRVPEPDAHPRTLLE